MKIWEKWTELKNMDKIEKKGKETVDESGQNCKMDKIEQNGQNWTKLKKWKY